MELLTIKNIFKSASSVLDIRPQNWLTDRNKEIAIVAIAIFACLAALYLIKRFFWDQKPQFQESAEKLIKDVGGDVKFYQHIMSITGYHQDPETYLKRWTTYRKNPKDFATPKKIEKILNTKKESESKNYYKVILDTGILVDPKAYLAHWKKERKKEPLKGLVRLPEDGIRQFLENLLDPKPITNPLVIKAIAFLEEIGMKEEDDKDFYLKVMHMTGYAKDPDNYLARWKEYREKSKEFEMKTEAIKEQLNAYKASPWYILDADDEALEELKQRYIKTGEAILATGILLHPKNYLEQWNLQRGGTHDFRYPDDPLRNFFNKAI